MPLHADLEAFLELVQAGADSGRPPMHALPLAQARADYDASSLVLDVPGDEVARCDDLEITARDGQTIAARLYVPNPSMPDPAVHGLDDDAAQPLLLYFHGGGYCVGGLDSHDSLCATLAARTPCRVLAVAYRLAPEHRFPTAFNDAEDAWHWALVHSNELGIDAQRIVVGGDSAGGTLAAALALSLRNGAVPPPVLQLLLYPCTSARQDSASHRQFAQGFLLEADTLQWMFSNYLRNDADREDWRFAPLQAEDVQGVAPAFVLVGDHDPLLDEAVAYAGKLTAAGVAVTLSVEAGMIHDFLRLGNVVDNADEARTRIAQALAHALYPDR